MVKYHKNYVVNIDYALFHLIQAHIFTLQIYPRKLFYYYRPVIVLLVKILPKPVNICHSVRIALN